MICLVTNAIRRLKDMIGGPVNLVDIMEVLAEKDLDECMVFDTLETMKELGFVTQFPGNELLYDLK